MTSLPLKNTNVTTSSPQFFPEKSIYSPPYPLLEKSTDRPSMRLNHIPLRPSTLAILKRQGFSTTLDVIRSADNIPNENNGSLHNFSIELKVTLAQAARIRREIRNALSYALGERSLMNDNRDYSRYTAKFPNNPYIIKKKKRKTLSYFKLSETPKSTSQTVANILSSQTQLQPIQSLVHSIDTLLGSGFAIGEVTELVGEPGSGKSQLGMQLCVNATIPENCGGTEGSAIYIDSEGSFVPERIFKMAKGIISHLSSIKYDPPIWYSSEYILNNIYRYRVYDETCQTATLISLPTFIKDLQKRKKKPKVIIVDSIAFPYRCSTSDYKIKTKKLINIASTLSNIASIFHVAVIVTNHMTVKGNVSDFHNSNFETDMNTRVMPALGEYWAHTITTRLLLSIDMEKSLQHYYYCDKEKEKHHLQEHGDFKICELIKCPYQPSGVVKFMITNDGVRDCL